MNYLRPNGKELAHRLALLNCQLVESAAYGLAQIARSRRCFRLGDTAELIDHFEVWKCSANVDSEPILHTSCPPIWTLSHRELHRVTARKSGTTCSTGPSRRYPDV